jgi:hypothetical protein
MKSRMLKLLGKARENPEGWSVSNLHTLYTGFGFVWKNRGKRAPHRVYAHPDYPILYGTAPHGRKIDVEYVKDAVKLIERLLQLKKTEPEEE